MLPKGKGFFIWKIASCEGGNVDSIADLAQAAGLGHVMVKIADGAYSSNVDQSGTDLVPPLVTALHAKDIQTWGWHYVYGTSPLSESAKAISRIGGLSLDGYIVNAEGYYKGKYTQATTFMNEMRKALPTFPMGLSSYRYPSLHQTLPWKQFRENMNFDQPQVYWLHAHNPAYQLGKSHDEFMAMTPKLPYAPTGAAYTEFGWLPTVADEMSFLDTAKLLELPAVNFYSWDSCRARLPADIWNTIADYEWPVENGNGEEPMTLCKVVAAALNIRSGPGVAFTDMGDLVKDTELAWFEAKKDAGGNDWLRISYSTEPALWINEVYGGNRNVVRL